MLRTIDHIRRDLAGPSKFSPKWEGPFMVREKPMQVGIIA